jgi:hypothetical protein
MHRGPLVSQAHGRSHGLPSYAPPLHVLRGGEWGGGGAGAMVIPGSHYPLSTQVKGCPYTVCPPLCAALQLASPQLSYPHLCIS